MKLFARQAAGPPVLRTARLELLPITPRLLEAEQAGREQLAALLGAAVLPEWPPAEWEPHVRAMIALQCAEQPGTAGWHRYVRLQAYVGGKGRAKTDPQREARAQLIGCLGAFPKQRGEVEIGYSTLPAFQRQGYASEAVCALIDWLLEQQTVTCVVAQAFLSKPESIKVMQRCGMQPAGAGDDPGTVKYRRLR